MKKLILTALWAIIWLGLQSTIFSSFPTANVRLDLIFIAVCSLAFYGEFADGIAAVLLLGFISDALSPVPFGVMTAVYTAAFIAIRMASSTIYLQSVSSRFIWTTIASAIAIWLQALLLVLIWQNPNSIKFAVMTFIQQSLLNGMIGVAVIPAFEWYVTITKDKIFKQKGLVLK